MGIAVRGNYVWCLVIVVLYMEFGGKKRWEVGDALKGSFGVAMHAKRGRVVFIGKGDSHYVNYCYIELYCKSYWVL